jgi:hypothetical protein
MTIKKAIDDRVKDNCGTIYVGTAGENEYCLARFDQGTEGVAQHLYKVTQAITGKVQYCLAPDAAAACCQCDDHWLPNLGYNAGYHLNTAERIPMRVRGWGKVEF